MNVNCKTKNITITTAKFDMQHSLYISDNQTKQIFFPGLDGMPLPTTPSTRWTKQMSVTEWANNDLMHIFVIINQNTFKREGLKSTPLMKTIFSPCWQ